MELLRTPIDRFENLPDYPYEPHYLTINTMLPTGDQGAGEAFERWRKFSQETPVFPACQIVNKGCVSELSEEEIAAYDAPFPDESYKE